MVVLVLVLMLIGLGIASVLGLTVDTRDPEYSLGRLLVPPDEQRQQGR